MKRKVMLGLVFLIIINMSFTGCATKTILVDDTKKILEETNSYAIHFANLINIFSINSASELIYSEHTGDCILLKYDNGDLLSASLLCYDKEQDIKIVYTSDHFFTTKEIEEMIKSVVGPDKEISAYEKEIIKHFVEKKEYVEFTISHTLFTLNVKDSTFTFNCNMKY